MKIRCLFTVLFVVVLYAPTLAGPAYQGTLPVAQPNGKTIKVVLKGDEFQHWVETTNGYTILKDKMTDYWVYAKKHGRQSFSSKLAKIRGLDLIATKIHADDGPPNVQKHLKPKINDALMKFQNELINKVRNTFHLYSKHDDPNPYAALNPSFHVVGLSGPQLAWDPRNIVGEKRMLIILVSFNDCKVRTSKTDWYNSVFKNDGSTKSVARFYADNSHNALTITPLAHTQDDNNTPGVISVTINQPHPNYGSNIGWDIETQWIANALREAANYVDFPSLDKDRNGYISAAEVVIYFIPAGYEASGTLKTPNIWAHAWGGEPGIPVAGKMLVNWAMNGELNDNNKQHPMGVVAHEMGHQMCGLPDLYDTSGKNGGLGAFSLMASGSWGSVPGEDGGSTPTNLDAWSRVYLGWDKSVIPEEPGQPLVFSPALSCPPVKLENAYASSTEYYLAENRYPTGWDQGIAGIIGDYSGGLLITHIDSSVGTEGSNNINRCAYGGHQGVVPVQASIRSCDMLGTQSLGCQEVLFYSENNDQLTPFSRPNSHFYNLRPSYRGLVRISSIGQQMNANFYKN